ncbi:MAG: hydrogenase iron-sulfur subunit [Candidatus Caenarcaniphilales bacterium]|nr:hydrogenase iron-sulfur subunit [Candidatus Caenarcaniphilales bacterium]
MVIACERSVNLDKELSGAHGRDLNGVSNAYVVRVPCSGMIQPRMIESAFNSGADGVIAMGCQIGDCHFREGNKFCRERLLGLRPPVIKKSVPKNRLKGFWMSEVQVKEFKQRVEDFKTEVAEELSKEAAKA